MTNALLLVSYESYELYGRSAVVYIGRCSFSSSKMIRFEKYGREVFWLMHARSVNSAVGYHSFSSAVMLKFAIDTMYALRKQCGFG